MADDQQLLIGKWTVWIKNWVWEYEFFPNGTVSWRDTRSYEKGNGKWSLSAKLINISWSGSGTKESWQRPLGELKNSRTWYNSAYYVGTYPIEKNKEVPKPGLSSLPKVNTPDDTIDIQYGPQQEKNYIDNLCTDVAYGIYNGGFYVYVPTSITQHPIVIPEKSLWFADSGTPITDGIYPNQAAALQAIGGVNQHHIAYYDGVGGNIICPTAFTYRTAPNIVNTASIVVDELIKQVQAELIGILATLVIRIAISTAGSIISRDIEVRRLKAREARARAALENARKNASPPAPIQGNMVRVGEGNTPGSLWASIQSTSDGGVVYRVDMIVLEGEGPTVLTARATHRAMIRRSAETAQAAGKSQFKMVGKQANPNFVRHADELAGKIGVAGSGKTGGQSFGYPDYEVTLDVGKALQ